METTKSPTAGSKKEASDLNFIDDPFPWRRISHRARELSIRVPTRRPSLKAPIRFFTYYEFAVREIYSGKTCARRNKLRRISGLTISRAAAQNNLVHSEGFRVYKVPIWAVKTEIVAIAPTLGRPRKTEC
jgi:hypothetical protein